MNPLHDGVPTPSTDGVQSKSPDGVPAPYTDDAPSPPPEAALDLFRLDDRVVVITGASSGLGERFARVLAGVGARLVLAARRTERIAALADELPDALAVTVDVTDDDGPQALIDATLAHYGRIDVLVNKRRSLPGGPSRRRRPRRLPP